MLREFFYVDVSRVKSLLAQLDEGVVDRVVKTRTDKGTSDLGAGALNFKATRATEATLASEESRSLQDMLFTIFEEVAESEGLLRDPETPTLSSPEAWESSLVHNDLVEGELIRVHTPVLVVDGQFAEARFKRFERLNEALVKLGEASLAGQVQTFENERRALMEQELDLATANKGRDQAKQMRRAAEVALKRDVATLEQAVRQTVAAPLDAGVQAVMEFVNRFLAGDAISVRFLACGPDRADLAFSGSLLGRDEYIQKEREALFSRYGSLLNGWTAVLQIARIPTEQERDDARARDFSNLDLTRGDQISRATAERVIADLLGFMEALGISEGPLWPGISVIPLGIYRVVPRSLGDEPPSDKT